MRHLLLTFLALTFLAAPAAASAYPAGPLVSDPQVDRWLGMGVAYWGAAPACPSGITVTLAEWSGEPNVWASAETPGCRMALDPDFWPRPAGADPYVWTLVACNVIAHEVGHLLGAAHTPDPTALMHPSPALVVPACAAEADALRAPLPALDELPDALQDLGRETVADRDLRRLRALHRTRAQRRRQMGPCVKWVRRGEFTPARCARRSKKPRTQVEREFGLT